MIAQLDRYYLQTRPGKAVDRLLSYTFFEGRPLTTAGRWINPVVFNILKLAKALPQLRKVEKPVFILGTGRSGTTLLGMLLSMHRDVGFLNEPKAIWHSIFPFEDVVGSYTESVAFYRLASPQAHHINVKDAHKIYGFYLRMLGKKRVVDKYPELTFRHGFVEHLFPDAKFIFIARNGFDTSVSIHQWSKENGKSESGIIEDWWGKNQRKWNLLIDDVLCYDDELGMHVDEFRTIEDHQNRGAVEWYLSMKEGLQLCATRKNFLMIRFEDLTSNPASSLRRVLDFMELPEDDKVIQYAQRVVKSVAGKTKFVLHPKLKPAFMTMMHKLNYQE